MSGVQVVQVVQQFTETFLAYAYELRFGENAAPCCTLHPGWPANAFAANRPEGDSLDAWRQRMVGVCAGCGCRALDADTGRCSRCGWRREERTSDPAPRSRIAAEGAASMGDYPVDVPRLRQVVPWLGTVRVAPPTAREVRHA